VDSKTQYPVDLKPLLERTSSLTKKFISENIDSVSFLYATIYQLSGLDYALTLWKRVNNTSSRDPIWKLAEEIKTTPPGSISTHNLSDSVPSEYTPTKSKKRLTAKQWVSEALNLTQSWIQKNALNIIYPGKYKTDISKIIEDGFSTFSAHMHEVSEIKAVNDRVTEQFTHAIYYVTHLVYCESDYGANVEFGFRIPLYKTLFGWYLLISKTDNLILKNKEILAEIIISLLIMKQSVKNNPDVKLPATWEQTTFKLLAAPEYLEKGIDRQFQKWHTNIVLAYLLSIIQSYKLH